MLKRELVNKVSEELQGYYKKDIAMAVDLILEEIALALIEGRRVEIRGFGSFSVRTRKPRTTKNPKTGKIMNISARKTLHFTMSKSLKESLIGKENRPWDKRAPSITIKTGVMQVHDTGFSFVSYNKIEILY